MTGAQINDMQANNPGEFNRMAQKFAEEKFVPQILGDNTNYSVKEVDAAGTEKAINQHAGRYANDGNIDRYTEKAQAGINNAKQQIAADQQEIKQSYDKQADTYNNHKGQVVKENIKNTAKNIPGAQTVAKKVEQTYDKVDKINTGIKENINNDLDALKEFNDNAMAPARNRDAIELTELSKIKPDSGIERSIEDNLTKK